MIFRADEDVHDALSRREPRNPFAVRADGGAGLDRIAEQVFARNERGWRVFARERPRRAE
jgi:hypothetical protein